MRQAGSVTGGALLGLVLLSMAWLFLLLGLAVNYRLLHPNVTLGFLPGVIGSLAVFFSIPALETYGVEVPWPWLWILLPLLVDPYCLPILVLLLIRRLRGSR